MEKEKKREIENVADNSKKEISKRQRNINIIISNIIRIILIGIIIHCILIKDYNKIFISLITIGLTYYPSILEKKFGIYLPIPLQVIITLFIFAAQVLGEMRGFYEKFWWWDSALHIISGFVLGLIGFMFVYLLNKQNLKEVHLSPFFVAIFAFCFAVTIDVFWEFFEFGVDRLMGGNMQKFRYPGEDGLIDTMVDLIVDAVGALVISIIGYGYMKKRINILDATYFRNWFKKEN